MDKLKHKIDLLLVVILCRLIPIMYGVPCCQVMSMLSNSLGYGWSYRSVLSTLLLFPELMSGLFSQPDFFQNTLHHSLQSAAASSHLPALVQYFHIMLCSTAGGQPTDFLPEASSFFRMFLGIVIFHLMHMGKPV